MDWHGFLSLPSSIAYLEKLGPEDILFHTEYNVHKCKIYGNSLKPWQDWMEVKIEDCMFQVQCLIFLTFQNVFKMTLQHLWIQCSNLEHMLLFILWVMIFLEIPQEICNYTELIKQFFINTMIAF